MELTRRIQHELGTVSNFCFDPGAVKTDTGLRFDLDSSVRALELASDLWTDLCIPIGIETWPCGPGLVDLNALAARLSGLPVSLLLNVGHLFLRQQRGQLDGLTMGEFVKRSPLPVHEVHVHDNDGSRDTHLTLGRGRVDRAEVTDAVSLLAEGAWITIESRPEGKSFALDDSRGFQEAADTIRYLEPYLHEPCAE